MSGLAAVQERMSAIAGLVQDLGAAPVTSTTTGTTTGTTTSTTTSAVAYAAAAAATGSTGAATTGPAGAVTGSDLVAAAERYVGTPYVWGGESLSEGGLDCSGLVQRSLADLGVTGVPRTAREQMTLGTAVPSLAQARPGDLLVFGGGSHIGIYVGDGQMVDAPKPGRSVAVRDVWTEPTAIRRVLPTADPLADPAGTTGAASTAAAQRAALDLLTSTSTADQGALL